MAEAPGAGAAAAQQPGAASGGAATANTSPPTGTATGGLMASAGGQPPRQTSASAAAAAAASVAEGGDDGGPSQQTPQPPQPLAAVGGAGSTTNLSASIPNADGDDSGSDSDANPDEIIEESKNGRWRKTNDLLSTPLSVEDSYRAYDNDKGFMVLWNEIPFSHSRRKKNRQKLVEKFELLKQIQHDNIAKFYDYWIDQKDKKFRVVYITELMTSGNLKGYIRRNKRNGKTIQNNVWTRWCRQILSALRYLHDCGIVHGNMKSSTVFIQHNGLIKIGAVCVDDLHHHVQTMKSMDDIGGQYFSPERISQETSEEGHWQNDPAIDVYAFGIVALEMISDTAPYAECDNYAQLFEAKTKGKLPACLDSVEKRKKEFILDCLQPVRQRKDANQLLFSPLLFKVPSLRLHAAHVLVRHRLKLDDDEKEEFEDWLEGEEEHFQEQYFGGPDAPCDGTRQCRCYTAHMKTGPKHYNGLQQVVEKCKPFKDLKAYFEEVRSGYHPLLFVQGQRHKLQRPEKPGKDTKEQLESKSETRRIADAINVDVRPDTNSESDHHFTIKYVLNELDEEGKFLRLQRSLEFNQPKGMDNLAEVSTKEMVEHGLLHHADRERVTSAIANALKGHR